MTHLTPHGAAWVNYKKVPSVLTMYDEDDEAVDNEIDENSDDADDVDDDDMMNMLVFGDV